MPRGGARSRALGKSAELRLARLLERLGWSVVRAPASGARRRNPVPDVIAMKRGVILMFEVKYRDDARSIYIEAEKYEGIKRFAENAGARVYLAVKLRGSEEWLVLPWSKAEKTTLKGRPAYAFYKHVIQSAIPLERLLQDFTPK